MAQGISFQCHSPKIVEKSVIEGTGPAKTLEHRGIFTINKKICALFQTYVLLSITLTSYSWFLGQQYIFPQDLGGNTYSLTFLRCMINVKVIFVNIKVCKVPF